MTDPIAELSMQKGPLVPETIRLKLKAANDKGSFLSTIEQVARLGHRGCVGLHREPP